MRRIIFLGVILIVCFLVASPPLLAGERPNILFVVADDMGWTSACTGPLDLFKMTVAEGGIRSPLLITGPGFRGGRWVDAFAYVWDIMPTVLELAGIPHPGVYRGRQVDRMRGKSLRNILIGSTKTAYGPDEFVGGEMQSGKWMRQGDFKAVSVAPPYGTGSWHLL